MAPLRALAGLLLATSLTGCIVLPVGHRHRHGYHAPQPVVVVPAPRHHEPYERDDRYYPPRRGR